MERVLVGCSGWVYKDWRGSFYPEKLPQREWLRHYAERFRTVEVNNTFYRLPSEAAVKGWIDETPDDFAFTIKGSRYTTHIKRLISPEKYTVKFFEAIKPIADAGKLAAVLWQFPKNFKADPDRLANMLEVTAKAGGRHCFEFRNATWFDERTYSMLREHDAALVIGDDPEFDFRTNEITAGWTYVRFHRSSHASSGKYQPREIDSWRRRIAAWRAKTEVLAYFNNDWEGYATENAEKLQASFQAP